MKRILKAATGVAGITGLGGLLALATLGAGIATRPAADQPTARRGMMPEDTWSVREVTALTVSPDGQTVAYPLAIPDSDSDSFKSRLYLTTVDGGEPHRVGRRDEDNEKPRFSRDGQLLA